MKQLFILLMMSCLLFSCDSSDDCTLDDWLGTYRGVKTCGIEVQDDYVFSIVRDNLFTGINTSSEIESVRIIVDGEFFFFSETQCSITGGNFSPFGSTTASSLEDGELRLRIEAMGDFCEWVANKI